MKTVNPIQLVMKANQLVDDLSILGRSTPADLAKVMNEPRPSIYRIISSLEQAEIVRRTPEGLVEMGTGILRLGEAAGDALVDRHALKKVLDDVQAQLGLTAAFWIPRNGTAVCLDQVDATDVDLYELSSGRILPLHAGAASHVLLAWQPGEVLQQVLASEPYAQLSAETPTDAQTLARLVEATRRDGWRLEANEVVNGIAALGFPVFNPDGSIFGALTAAGLVEHVVGQQAEAKTVLSAAAQALTEVMASFQPEPTGSEFEAPDSQGSVLTKAHALMRALASERVSTSSRLTELLGEPVSSVYRMLATLIEAGWVEQLGHRGSYRVGSKMLSLSGKMLNSLDLRRAALPVLRSIHDATGETAFLCIRRNTRAVCIERIDGKRVNSRRLALGSSLPLHVGAAPRALLAFEDQQAWEDYAGMLAQSADSRFDVRSRSKFFSELTAIRERGYALSDDELTPGIAAVGAPIFDHRGHVVASLSVSGLRDGILTSTPESAGAIALASEGARELSIYLGAPSMS
ncbi:IclR family transcriptional regulator [Arthrobacter crystallopoietes]|uniref:IclR family transcriptional regulator n=1 Tax=Crystallibacter crystallopoietes TaxID=37928 RepID=UPI000CA1AE5F|nr:IclR family transcriptional regulator C-terminal domain-containing protein [Arthrobacter crystallopoietes]AUI51968.1 hypothetical protein AC20117_15420 [Arthrobacter crystallopoietes]